MRRLLIALIVLGGIAGVLVATGAIRVRVQVEPAAWVSAAPFWRDEPGTAKLPEALALWVELAKAAPAVVNVSTQAHGSDRAEFFRRFFEGGPPGRRGPRSSLGSGFIISPDGYVVTNNHVVASGGDIVVRLCRGTEHPARVWSAPIPRPTSRCSRSTPRAWPCSRSATPTGCRSGSRSWQSATRSGSSQTVTTGIVSAKERVHRRGPYDEFVQTDTSINPGNSGGPLLDSRGAVVGINTAIFSQPSGSVGIGFAIPSSLVRALLPQLERPGG